MNPTPGDVYVSLPLTNISTAYLQDQGVYIADKVFPIVPVTLQSGTYFAYDKGDFYRVEARERAPGAESAGAGFKVSNQPAYYARVNAVHKDVDDQTRAAAMNPIDLDNAATQYVTQQMLLKRELDWANNFFKTGIWSVERTGVASGAVPGTSFLQWDNANSTPLTDVNNLKADFTERTGFVPNVLVLGPRVAAALENNAQILNRIVYTERGIITENMLAGIFNVDRVVIPKAVVNLQKEGVAPTYSYVFGKSALLAYAAPAPSFLAPSAGYTFSWTGYLGANAAGARIKRFRIEQIASDRVEGEMAYDMKVIATDLGTFLNTAVS